MSIQNFKPEVWSAELLVALRKSLVYAAPGVVNRDYEGEISQAGDTVHVTSLNDPTIGNYTPYVDIDIEEPTDEGTALTINQSKYWAFEADDVDKRQARGEFVTELTSRAAYKLRDIADQYVAAQMALSVLPANVIAEETITASDAYDVLVDLGVRLDEANVPEESRWAIVTPKFHGLLLKDPRFVAAGDAQGAATRTNGIIGSAAGFSLRKSNNAPNGPGAGAGKLVLAGSNIATSYAEQINKTEATRKEKGFADIVKGLHLYGAKVFRPEALAAADVII